MPATWGDIVSLVVISTLFFGAVAGFIYVTEAAKKAAEDKDSELRSRGITLTPTGIAIKTDKQAPTREDLIDSQSRAVLRGGEALARPGVLSAGQQTSFRVEQDTIPSAFETPEESEQRKTRLRSNRNKAE